jgi:uncharacterized membrane-anchored protein YjiN (DUF445 family)
MLVAVTLGFVVVELVAGDGRAVGYLRAALEASMVGALADWFAVVALFRHPLGIPIPHTAVVPARKDSFGETLGEFVQSSFLTPDNVAERVRAARVAERLAAWLAAPGNAERLARHLADAAVTAADLLRDDDVHRAVEDAVRQRVESTPLAPLAGRALGLLTDGGRHHEVLDVALKGVDRFLDENQARLRARFSAEAPWWLPETLEGRLFERLLDGARTLIHEVASNPHHELRVEFDARIRQLVVDLQTSEHLRARGEELKHDLLAQAELRAWVATVWRDVKDHLRDQAADPDSDLRRRLAEAVRSLGQRLGDDPALADRLERGIEVAARYVSEHFDEDVAAMVTTTIGRWDGHETADRLELLLGPDLQFIRINGTVVGGLAGLAIHALSQGLG